MSKIRRSLVAAAATSAVALLAAPGASAAPAPVVCDGALSNVAVGDVTVPYDASCTLTNVMVAGDVTAEQDANTVTLERTAVSGDVTTNSRRLVVRGSAVRGDVVAQEPSGGVVVTRSAVQGDLTTRAPQGELRLGGLDSVRDGNVVGGTLTVASSFVDGLVARNVVGGGLVVVDAQAAVELRRNVVRGALDCTGNTPAPVGGSNLAGSKLGQCSGL